MTLCYAEMEVYECVKNMNPQYLNEMLILKKYRYDLGDNSLLDRPTGSTKIFQKLCCRNMEHSPNII